MEELKKSITDQTQVSYIIEDSNMLKEIMDRLDNYRVGYSSIYDTLNWKLYVNYKDKDIADELILHNKG